MSSSYKINVNVLGMTLSMRVTTTQQEEEIRKAEKLIKEKYENYKKRYDNLNSDNPEENLLLAAMTLLDLAKTSVKNRSLSNISGTEILDELAELNTLVEDYLYPHHKQGETQHKFN